MARGAVSSAVSPRLPSIFRLTSLTGVTRPLVIRRLENTPTTNAMVRTTTAVTMFQAGTEENVLASRARAVVNFRILPGDSTASVLEHVRAVSTMSA